MVFSPGALDGYPATFISGMRVPDDGKAALVQLVRTHPTVSVIDIDAILLQIKGIIDKASLAVQAVFVFTLAAGIAVLFAAVQSTIDERRFESAMLRALGVRRRTVMSGVLTEFAALGFAAGCSLRPVPPFLPPSSPSDLFDLDIYIQRHPVGCGPHRRHCAGLRQRVCRRPWGYQRSAHRCPSRRLKTNETPRYGVGFGAKCSCTYLYTPLCRRTPPCLGTSHSSSGSDRKSWPDTVSGFGSIARLQIFRGCCGT